MQPNTCKYGSDWIRIRKTALNSILFLLIRPTVLACIAERAFLRVLEGGCSVPVAVTSHLLPAGIRLTGGVWSLNGSQNIKADHEEDFPGTAIDAEDINHNSEKGETVSYAAIAASNLMRSELVAAEKCGRMLAQQLIGQGAVALLKEARAQNDKK